MHFDTLHLSTMYADCRYLKYYNVAKPVAVAKKMLEMNGILNRTDRLAVMLLYSHPIEHNSYGPCLKCSLHYYTTNLQPNTPSDLFLFVKPEVIQQISGLSWIRDTPNLYIMQLDDTDVASWKIPEWVRPEGVSES